MRHANSPSHLTTSQPSVNIHLTQTTATGARSVIMSAKKTISAMRWYSLSAKDRQALSVFGVGPEASLVKSFELAISVVDSNLVAKYFRQGQTQDHASSIQAFDKAAATERLEMLQKFVDNIAALTSDQFVAYLNNSYNIAYMEAPLVLLAKTVYKFSVLGLTEAFYMAKESFGSYELRTDWTKASKEQENLMQRDSWNLDEILPRRLMYFADIADILHPSS